MLIIFFPLDILFKIFDYLNNNGKLGLLLSSKYLYNILSFKTLVITRNRHVDFNERHFSALKTLVITRNRHVDFNKRHFSALKTLDISRNTFQDLNSLTCLTDLDISYTNIYEIGICKLANLTRLNMYKINA